MQSPFDSPAPEQAAPSSTTPIVLPVLEHLGGITQARMALDLATETRRGFLLVGPKGTGKGLGTSYAMTWYLDREVERGRDRTYRRQRVVRVSSLRGTTYLDTMLRVARALDKHYEPSVAGRPKGNDVRDDIIRNCLKDRVAALIIDEGELLTSEALDALRDILANAEEEDATRLADGGVAAAGVGIVLIGDDTLESKVNLTNEARERWVRPIRVPLLGPDDVVEVYDIWFPGFAPERERLGPHLWPNYLSSLICRGRGVSFRLLANHARVYALHMQRLDTSLRTLESIPLDLTLFQQTFDETLWSNNTPQDHYTGTSRGYSQRTSWGGHRGDE